MKAHHQVNVPDTGKNSGGRRKKKIKKKKKKKKYNQLGGPNSKVRLEIIIVLGIIFHNLELWQIAISVALDLALGLNPFKVCL